MFLRTYLLKQEIKQNSYFIWKNESKNIQPIKSFKPLNLDLIIGVERQKNILLNNTRSFAEGNFTNNALLWGARGNGKSSLIKSVFHEVLSTFKTLKLIQLNKDNIFDIDLIYQLISKLSDYRFIIFIDDLSFEKIDSDYKIFNQYAPDEFKKESNNGY